MRWTTLTIDHLKAAGFGTIVDRARTLATGGIDPALEAIDNATARVRRAIATGNALDSDATKVPNSLKGVAEKIVLYDLMERIGLPLSADQQQRQRDIAADLSRLADERLRVEAADTPDGTSEMQANPLPRIEPRSRNFTDQTTDGI